ncbi:MAG: glycerol-3-phosphate responsive antiterminator [Clostridiales bacterium]|nr:glycerol-3-phosphate responsive antiterminator [Clostridiales bacterium]
MDLFQQLKKSPIIAAIRDEEQLKKALATDVDFIFVLAADIFSITTYIKRIRQTGKKSFVHIDFLEGLGKDRKAIEFIARKIKPDGIISTRSNLITYAKEYHLLTIQRFFLIDSQSLKTCIKTINHVHSDMVEIMPGIMPNIIKTISLKVKTPVIAGGLISKKDQVEALLKNGAIGISTGNSILW